MKRNFYFFPVLVLFILSSPKCLFGQAFPNLFNPANGAYITKVIGVTDVDFRQWSDPEVWTRLKGNPTHYTIPPPTTSTQFTQNTYIEIAAGHKVHLKEVLKFGNKLTLVICGELKIDELLELPEILTLSANLDLEKETLVFRGRVLYSVNLLKEEFGFYIQYKDVFVKINTAIPSGAPYEFTREITFKDLKNLINAQLAPADTISDVLGISLTYQAFGSNLDGTGYGNFEPYTVGSPEVETLGGSLIENSITFSGSLSSNPYGNITSRGFIIQFITSAGELKEVTVTCGTNFLYAATIDGLNNLFGFDAGSSEKIQLGDLINVQAFAMNDIYGTGYGLNLPFLIQESSSTKEIGGGDYNFVNSLTLIVCEGGILHMNTLRVKNVTDIEVNGTFYVDSIFGFSAPTNCIFGTGVISTGSGLAPYINDGFSYGMGNPEGNDCQQNPPVILPISLLSFDSEVKPDRVDFSWTTASEINNDYFTLERSRDLYGWEVLGFVKGAGNSSVPLDYSFSDMQPLDGLAYYRLKQTDFDGKFKFYGPIAAQYDLGLDGLEFKVMKNFSNWLIAVPNDGVYQVEVYNLEGHCLHSQRVENTLKIPAPRGAVVIRVTDGYERSASRVVM